MIYTVIQAVGLLGDGVDYTTPGALFEAMAEVFFTDATVNDKEGTKFTFDFDLKKDWTLRFQETRSSVCPKYCKSYSLPYQKSRTMKICSRKLLLLKVRLT